MRARVVIATLVGALLLATVPGCGPTADLVPANPEGWAGFCDVDDRGRLVIHVGNQGAAAGGESMTKVEFFFTGAAPPVELGTQAVQAAGGVVEVVPHVEIPAGCWDPDCDFRITVDSTGKVIEANEGNNSVEGTCIG